MISPKVSHLHVAVLTKIIYLCYNQLSSIRFKIGNIYVVAHWNFLLRHMAIDVFDHFEVFSVHYDLKHGKKYNFSPKILSFFQSKNCIFHSFKHFFCAKIDFLPFLK